MKNRAVLLGIQEGMFTVDLPRYVVKAIGFRTNAVKLHIILKDDKYEYFINDKKILAQQKDSLTGTTTGEKE